MNTKKLGNYLKIKRLISLSSFNLSEGNVPVLLEKNKDLMKLAGSWRSEIGALDQYGKCLQ